VEKKWQNVKIELKYNHIIFESTDNFYVNWYLFFNFYVIKQRV